MLRILTWPTHPLNEKAIKVTWPEGDKEPARLKRHQIYLQKVIDEMAEVMYDGAGIGLAAPQVGINQRIIVMDCGKGFKHFVNPRLIFSPRKTTVSMEEGCLSLPGMRVMIERPEQVQVRYQTILGEPEKMIFLNGLEARCIQHEIDHLDGLTMLDRLSSSQRQKALKRWQKQFPEGKK